MNAIDNVPIQEVFIKNDNGIRLFIKREDLIHPFISGNKYRKLKYNIKEAKQIDGKSLLTFGGAFSNHIAAVAYAGKQNGFNTIGVIRGDELATNTVLNPTLQFAKDNGMIFHFISRELYKKKTSESFNVDLRNKFGDFYLIPEGGTNKLAVQGCEEILTKEDYQYNYVCCCVGTGGTISGLINSSHSSQKILGFPALKGEFLRREILKFAKANNWELVNDYHFGGYAKINESLVTFINKFQSNHNVLLDPIYTGKMLYGIVDMIEKNQFEKGSKILAIHSGGLQGIVGMNEILKARGLPLINT